MRQILIVKSNTTLNSSFTDGRDGRDLTSLQDGALAVYSLTDYKPLTAAPETNFAIALGRPNGQAPFIISEVDTKSLIVTKQTPKNGQDFSVAINFANVTLKPNADYSIRLFKKGVVPHERNSWTVMVNTGTNTSTAANLANKFKTQIDAKLSDKFDITAQINSNSTLTLTAKSDWEIMLVDELASLTITPTYFEPATGDKAYIENLAKFCAAGKGFNYTHSEGVDAIPGYPETVEDTKYAVYNLRFKVHRDSSRTLDMGIWQEVNIAVPTSNSNLISSLDTLFKEEKN